MAEKVIDINRKRRNVRTNTAQGSRHKVRKGSQHGHVVETGSQDLTLVLIILFLIGFGLVMLYTASSYEAGINYGDSMYYLKRQMFSTAIGLVVMMIVAQWDYNRVWRKLAWLLYWGSLIAVIAVKFIGREVNGAKRWIVVGPVSVQPAEFSKIAVIVLTSLIISRMSVSRLHTKEAIFQVLWPCLLQAACILFLNSNMSTAGIVAAIGVGIFFVARKEYLSFFVVGFGVLAAFGGYVAWLKSGMASESTMGFRSSRILAWLDPVKYADGIGFQTLQGLYGIGSGGIFGKGLGESMQKLGYIPEAQNDMIFSIICEELGLFGALSIITLFIILCWRFMDAAWNAQDLFGGLIASGVMTHIAVQVILNIAVVTASFPNTGVTLPFISYGGTSVIILLAEVGIVINISKIRREKES